jgi:hypothetical protein
MGMVEGGAGRWWGRMEADGGGGFGGERRRMRRKGMGSTVLEKMRRKRLSP